MQTEVKRDYFQARLAFAHERILNCLSSKCMLIKCSDSHSEPTFIETTDNEQLNDIIMLLHKREREYAMRETLADETPAENDQERCSHRHS